MKPIAKRHNPLFLIWKKQTQDAVYSVEEFRAVIQRECARTDRSGNGFSLVVLTLRDNPPDQKTPVQVARVVADRVRSSDEVGWLGTASLGVVLPDTPIAQARTLADDLYGRIPRGQVSAVSIYSYPSEWTGNFPNNRQNFSSEAARREPGQANSPMIGITKSEISGDGIECFLTDGIPVWKRLIDIFGGGLCFLLLLPVLLAVGVLTKLVSPGPVLFQQERLGHLGKPFTMWKFRTMSADADTRVHEEHLRTLIQSDAAMRKLDDAVDARLIPFGKFLRQLGLDELPQLINVLRGEMSLIGPRPCTAYEAREYSIWQRKRFNTMPGLTGLWQVSGKNKTTHTEMMRLDINYIRKRSLFLDLKIAIKTSPAIIHQAVESLALKKGGKYAESK